MRRDAGRGDSAAGHREDECNQRDDHRRADPNLSSNHESVLPFWWLGSALCTQISRRSTLAILDCMTDSDTELFGPEHVRVYRETDGERGYHWRKGSTILLLNTIGRKSGEERTMPLIHRTDGDRYVIVASKGGTPDDPIWYKNLQADPEVTIQVKGEVIPVRAHDAEGEERDRLWNYLAEMWPDYNEYQKKTDRKIPVVVLEPR
jgi:proline iminopeptidase